MKRFISILLSSIMILLFAMTMVSATEDIPTSNGSSGSSGGGGGMAKPVSKPVEVLEEYTVSGTIYLPSGTTAPTGGLKIYGGFGGVSYSELSTASTLSTENYIKEKSNVNYEKSEVIAIIPEGQTYATYNTTCTIGSSYDGIYGKFWVSDNIICGNTVLSNKQTLSSTVNLRADVYEYSNINCILNSASTMASYTITCDDILASEDINTDVYVIADDGYDKYISRINYDNDSSTSGVLNLESSGTYDLYYYIPSSSSLAMQKLDKGLFNIGALDINNPNTIVLKSQLYISGKIKLPDGYTATKDLTVTLKTTISKVHIVIPKGTISVPYIIGASFSDDGEYLNVSVDDEYIISGYYVDDGSFDNYEFNLWYDDTTESIEHYNIKLQEQYLVKGTVSIPDDIVMTENTYLKVRVGVKNLLTGYNDYAWLYILSDEKSADYKISIPKSECVDKFIISYDYGSYSTVTVPTFASNPLPYYRNPSSGGGSGSSRPSGGGSVSPSTIISKDDITYTSDKPTGLLYGCKFYVEDAKITIFDEEAKGYTFINKNINKNFSLIKNEEIYAGTIAGYFADYINEELYTMIEVSLYNSENKVVCKKIIDANEGYCFEGLGKGQYKIGFMYNDKQYYYNNKYLVNDINDAEIIVLTDEIISNHNDVYFDNIFNANIKLYCEDILINNNYYGNQFVKVYNPYKKVVLEVPNSTVIKVKMSSFYLGIGDYFVSDFEIADGICTITKLTDSIDKAYLFNCEYIDTISKDFFREANNTFRVNAITELYNTPITSTTYELSGNEIHYLVSMNNPIYDCEIIVSAYDSDGRLVDICSDEGVSEQPEYLLNMKFSPDICKIKTMVWSSISSLQPLGKAEEQTVNLNILNDEIYKKIADAYYVIDDKKYYLNGEEHHSDFTPTLINYNVYLPIRVFGEAMGLTVIWNEETQSITLMSTTRGCILTLNDNMAQIYDIDNKGNICNSKNVNLYVSPIIVNDRTLIPLMEIYELFGYDVYKKDNTIAVFSKTSNKCKYAYDNGLINTKKVCFSSLNDNITRIEMASLLVELYEKSTGNTVIPSDCCPTDIYDIDINKAITLGIMNGYEDGTFKPYMNLTYAEAITITYRTVMKINDKLKNIYSKVPEYDSIPYNSTHWATNYLYNSKELGLLDDVCYDDIKIDDLINHIDAIGIVANSYKQLNMSDEEKFLTICNSGIIFDGIINALKTDLFEYYRYDMIKNLSDNIIQGLAEKMYLECTFYSSVNQFDSVLQKAFKDLFPSAPSTAYNS